MIYQLGSQKNALFTSYIDDQRALKLGDKALIVYEPWSKRAALAVKVAASDGYERSQYMRLTFRIGIKVVWIDLVALKVLFTPQSNLLVCKPLNAALLEGTL